MPPNNTEHAAQRTGENAQSNSDNDSEHGSDTSSNSKYEQTEARKDFRHVLNTPNPERFTGDRKHYKLWKITLESEVENIDRTSSMWIKLLLARTKSDALEVVQEARKI